MRILDNHSRKVTFDMTVVHGTWAVWYIAISLLIYLVVPLFGGEVKGGNQLGDLVTRILTGAWEGDAPSSERGFVNFITNHPKIFMLICGIISVYGFLTYYVKQGVTRKAYYLGSIISSAILSVMISLVAMLIQLVEQWIVGTGEGVGQSWLVAALAFSLNIWFYYVVGSLIGIGFYRFGIGGLLFIVLAVAMAFALEALWGTALADWFHLSGSTGLFISFAGTLLLLFIVLQIVRVLTRKARIRL